jgi:hypothetical protein
MVIGQATIVKCRLIIRSQADCLVVVLNSAIVLALLSEGVSTVVECEFVIRLETDREIELMDRAVIRPAIAICISKTRRLMDRN